MVIKREILIQKLADSLNLSPTDIQEAQSKYLGLSNYLKSFFPLSEAYLQGSYRLGTAIKPYIKDKEGDFDLDIVHESTDGTNLQPGAVKNRLGDALKKAPQYNKYLDEEGKKCWTLEYENFHIDVLPCIHDFGNPAFPTRIKLTHKDPDTKAYSFRSSDPKAFAKWFFGINDGLLWDKENQRSLLFEKNKAFFTENLKVRDFQAVDERFLSSPLQAAIKILKRHRDVFFCNNKLEESKPISIIITVIASRIAKEKNVSTVYGILDSFGSYAKNYVQSNGKYILLNPVDEKENFTDRWSENNGSRAKAFFMWVDGLQNFMRQISNINDSQIESYFSQYFGTAVAKILNEALKKNGTIPDLSNATSPKPWSRNGK